MASPDPSRKAPKPSSTLLQDLLREKKAETQRVKKTYNMDGADDRGVQSSPIASMSTRDRQTSHARRGSGGGTRNISMPKEMSMKEMELHISKINKQNFDLKLEIFHRRQRSDDMEAKSKEIEALKLDIEEMQSINESLLLELEKRDEAVKEAVGFIMELDAKVEAMEAKIEEMGAAELYFGQSRTLSTIPASSTASLRPEDSSTPLQAGRQSPVLRQDPPEDLESEASPSHTSAGAVSPHPAEPSLRIPSFLRENNKSTHVLRSLYSSESLFSGDENEDDMDGHIINSPRLSILSESGFSEIYGDTRGSDRSSSRQPDDSNVPEQSPIAATSPRGTHREAWLQKWVKERNRPTSPTRTSPKPAANDRFSSIGEVLKKVPSATIERQPTAKAPHERKGRQERSPEKLERKEIRQHQRQPSSPAFGGPMFGGAMLPPTPGTMSTVTIAGNSSTPSIVTEKSLLDGTCHSSGGYSTSIPGGRPGSSDSNFAHYSGNALTFDDGSDDEPESPRRKRSPKAAQISAADTLTRPSLTTSATATVFSGAGYATIQPSRTLSYPSPNARAQRRSDQLSPTSEKSSITIGDRTSSVAQQDHRSTSSANTTPTKRAARQPHPRSPPPNQAPTTPIADPSDAPPDTDPKLGRSASLRSKITKMSLNPSQSSRQSVASRLFRRSISYSLQPPSNTQAPTTSRPPIARDNSSRGHARLPRPSSLYGSSPTYAHLGTAAAEESAGEKRSGADGRSNIPVHTRRHSAVLDMGVGNWDRDERRRDSKSRQSIRGEDGKGGRWPLGRTASAKIRDGFGFKRAVGTQWV